MALNEIYARMLLFVDDASNRHPKITALVEPLKQTASLDLFLRVFSGQPQVQPLITACKTGSEEDRKNIVLELIDQMLLEAGIIREVDLVDATVDLDKLSRYLILWADVIAHR